MLPGVVTAEVSCGFGDAQKRAFIEGVENYGMSHLILLRLIAKLCDGRADERGLLEFIRDEGNRAKDFHDTTDGAKEGDFPL